MYKHIILISSSFTTGQRIGWHYSGKNIPKSVTNNIIDKSKEYLTSINYSSHILSTDSPSWESVVKYDSFFDGICIYHHIEDFFITMNKDKEVTALDIARYVLTLKPMSNLKLQKVLFLIYANFLNKTNKKLFKEEFTAFPYGPVVKEVYRHFKDKGKIDINEKIELKNITMPMMYSKILKSDDYEDIFESVKDVFNKYSNKTASELVNITHVKGGPWDRTELHNIITDDLILKYHYLETQDVL